MWLLAEVTKVTIGDAFGLAGVSISIILGILVSVMGLIYLLAFTLKQVEKLEKKRSLKKISQVQETEPEATPKKNLAKGTAGDINLFNVPDRDAAMIMAIVADTIGLPINELRFISIKEVTPGGQKDEI